MVRENPRISRDPVETSGFFDADNVQSYWEGRHTLHPPNIPVFLARDADRVLSSGKYLNVVRHCIARALLGLRRRAALIASGGGGGDGSAREARARLARQVERLAVGRGGRGAARALAGGGGAAGGAARGGARVHALRHGERRPRARHRAGLPVRR